MLWIKSKVQSSSIHGLGLFADEFIPKGKLIWSYAEGFDQRFSDVDFLALPEKAQIYLISYSWFSSQSKKYVLCADDGIYINHSTSPNCESRYRSGVNEVETLALEDIQAGEEITEDYRSFEGAAEENLLPRIAREHGMAFFDPRA